MASRLESFFVSKPICDSFMLPLYFGSIIIVNMNMKDELEKLSQELRTAPASEKAAIGAKYNVLRKQYEEHLRIEAQAAKEREIQERLKSDPLVDITNPLVGRSLGGPTFPQTPLSGGLHPITAVMRDVNEVFADMGFIIEDGREIVTEYECFDSLNSPKNHPSRDMQDTFWLSDHRCLRTQTSAWQNYMIKKYGPEFRAICPGRTYRNENIDATHDTTFFQVEGMMIGADISIANLIYFMKEALTAVFKKEINVRLRPGYFPFVEPGFELDASCIFCDGGCPICKHTGWVEFCGCGMIHPNVLREGGIDPEKYQGFAFGFGLTRLAMMRYGVTDIRLFNGGNLEFLGGVTGGAGDVVTRKGGKS